MSQQVIGDWNLRNFPPPPINNRKIIVVYQGGIYKARYEGCENSAFGDTPKDAASKLKFWGAETYNHKQREVGQ
jgi:hypothetical protein